MSTLAVILQILLLIVGMFMILIILLQRGRGGGLAGAFGGAGGQSAFGTKAGDVFTRFTVVLATLWVLLAGFSGIAMRGSAESFGGRFGAGPTGVEATDGDKKGETTEDARIPLSPSDLSLPPVLPAKGTEAGSATTPPALPEQQPAASEGAAPAAPEAKPAAEDKPVEAAPAAAKPAEESGDAQTPPTEGAPASDAPAETKPESGDAAPAAPSETSNQNG